MLSERLNSHPNVPFAVHYFISNQVNHFERNWIVRKQTKPRGMPRIMISYKSESVNYSKPQSCVNADFVLLVKFIRHIDKTNLSCVCLVSLQYSHMIKLLLLHVRSQPCHQECPFTSCTCSKINHQKLTNNQNLTYRVSRDQQCSLPFPKYRQSLRRYM